MKLRTSFLFCMAVLLTTAVLTSCSHEKLSSEDLFFQALEQSFSKDYTNAVHSFSLILEKDDEWADVASEQLLSLLSSHPGLEVSQTVLKTARSYHPLKKTQINTRKDYPLKYSAESLSSFSYSMIDDIVSSWLSSDADKNKAAKLLAQAASLKKEKAVSPDEMEELWLLTFNTGRMYEKCGSSCWQTALNYYAESRALSYSDLTSDRSLWYYLELSRKSDPRGTATNLSLYAASWHDNSYFDDFFDRLAADILSNYDWSSFYTVFQNNEPFMSPSIKAKYAYISARLIQTGLIKTENDDRTTGMITDGLYQTVFNNAEPGSYYDILTHYLTETPFTPCSTDETEGDGFAEQLLGKLVEHDYPELTSYYLNRFCSKLSTPVIQNVYNYLLSKPGTNSNYLSLTSLALKTARNRNNDPTLMHLAFPVYYRTYVEAEARRNNLKPWLIFALIHSESCFQADITSVAGANGLTQLMASTAGDIARKLKVSEYDLTDAETNIRFGSYYLNELIGRLDGDILLASFSYNAGITRVRNWKKQAPELPSDIFLETIPYEETRLYGQKITRASVMYGMLWYDENFADIIEKLIF